MKKTGKVLLLLSAAHWANAQTIIEKSKATLQSPDKAYTVQFYQKQLTDSTCSMYYTVSYKGKPVVNESAMDIQLDNHLSEQAMALKVDRHRKWCENLTVTNITTASRDTSWVPVVGEKNLIPDACNATTIHLVKDDYDLYKMDVELRAYNEGIAFRYFFPENEKGTYYRVTAENTEFCLPEDTKAWFTGWAQGKYELLPLSNWPQESERPLTLQLGNGLYACLAEAAMTDYARAKFTLSKEKPNTVLTSMDTPADLISPVATPWRVVMAADRWGSLIENNYLLPNLNEPSRISNTAWIQPGRFMRLMVQTTQDAKENIDFALKHHMQSILIDWKWYGPPFTFKSDATKVAIPDFDLPGIIQYGRERGIGVWLYVNLQALYAQSDSLFRVYHSWGVKGIKFGFVIPGSHRWITWLEEMIRKCAENELMVDVHDDWRPTGEQRTWPNLMTAEGIRGNEEMPDATHNTVLPFTRFMAGPADYTLCYYDKRIKNTHAHQLAMAAVYYSPMQTLFWYDKPSFSHDEPELEFWDRIPASWDETKVLQGAPGQFITTARRKGEQWFVGTLNNIQAKTINLDFSFLPKGKKYTATFYSDDDAVTTATKVKLETKTITAATQLPVVLKASGGQAVWIRPQ